MVFFTMMGLCLQNSLSVIWFGFCLLLGLFLGWWLCLVFGLCVCGLVVRFGIWFVCCLVGG